MATLAPRRQYAPRRGNGYAKVGYSLPVELDDFIRAEAAASNRSQSLVASELLEAGRKALADEETAR